EIAVPAWDLDHNLACPIGHALAAQPRLDCHAARLFELVQFVVRRLVAALQSLADDDVTGRAGADAPAAMVQLDTGSLGDVEDTARQAMSSVGQFLGINLEHLPRGHEGDTIFRLWRFGVRLDIGINSTHEVLRVWDPHTAWEEYAGLWRFPRGAGRFLLLVYGERRGKQMWEESGGRGRTFRRGDVTFPRSRAVLSAPSCAAPTRGRWSVRCT